jgi:hypothetical protein
MVTKPIANSLVEHIALAQEVDHRVALATVRLSDVVIRGIAVWRNRHGKLRVYFPSYKLGAGWEDAIAVPAELRAQVEADVISAYKAAKDAARKSVDNPENEESSKNAL